MRTRLLLVAAVCFSMFAGSSSALDASGSNTDSAEPAQPVVESTPPTAKGGMSIGSKVGVAVKMSLLGVGIEAATPITFHTNVRAGFNAFSYNRGFSNDGVNYAADLSFRSFETHFDWFPFGGGFHLSPGVMVYNGNQIKASAAVPGSQTFSLNSTNYMSDPANPITGSGKIAFNKVGPMFSLGWGNLVPRSNKHIVVPFEMGILFQGSPQATLALAGNACDSTGANCHNITGDSTFQSNVIGQQKKLNNDMSFFQVYPIISLGFGYKF